MKLRTAYLAIFLLVGYSQFSLAGANERIAKRNATIEKLQNKNTEDQLRLANLAEVEKQVSKLEGMSISDSKSANIACKEISSITTLIKSLKNPKASPLDGNGNKLKKRIQKVSSNIKKASKGASCEMIDFFVDDTNPEE